MIRLTVTPEEKKEILEGETIYSNGNMSFHKNKRGIILNTECGLYIVTPREFETMRSVEVPNNSKKQLLG